MANCKIELKDFLNFLVLACKVNLQENTEEIRNLELDLSELTSNSLVTRLLEHLQQAKITGDRRSEIPQPLILQNPWLKRNSVGNMTADLEVKNVAADLVDIENLNGIVELLKGKLFELLNEGIFDSILTYLTPSKFVPANVNPTPIQSESKLATGPKKKKEKKKKNVAEVKSVLKNETEVEIHVYDEVKGFKRDFKCLQSLLTSNMGYFSEITKGQKLEEMDISVHCDISIFEWLMKWIKRGSHANSSAENSPKLDYKNVVPIMVSANFLQIKPLFQDCLYFCKANLSDVIKFSSNLTCLSDHILKKLSDKLSNTEVQQLKDKKDKIKSRLFCQLIMSLGEEEPEKHRGHYASLAYLYFCFNCGKLVTRVSAPYVPCQVQYITIKYNGDVIFNHSRDPKWNINDHIRNIWMEYKSWSCTYWRLWSQCHFLYCYMCHTMYAVAFADCCPYHPQQPHFYPMEQFQSTNSPIGRYPCCGSKAIRYETIMMRSGCKLRSHIPKLLTNDDTCIQTIIDSFPDLIKMKYAEDNVAQFVEDYDLANFDGLYKNTFLDKDNGQSFNLGLLRGPLFEAYIKSVKKYKSVGTWEPKHEANTSRVAEPFGSTDYCSIGESESSDVSYIQDLSSIINRPNTAEACEETVQLKNIKSEMKPIWSSKYTIRHNQDNQRDYEEIAFQAMSEILLQRNELEKPDNRRPFSNETNYNLGGTYVQIESEWKEMHLRSSGNKLVNK